VKVHAGGPRSGGLTINLTFDATVTAANAPKLATACNNAAQEFANFSRPDHDPKHGEGARGHRDIRARAEQPTPLESLTYNVHPQKRAPIWNAKTEDDGGTFVRVPKTNLPARQPDAGARPGLGVKSNQGTEAWA